MVSVFSGFLASVGLMNFLLAYFTVALGDFIGDLMYYSFGKFGREKFIKTKGHYIGVSMEKVQKLEKHFEKHAFKTLFTGKLLHGIGTITLVAAGIANVGYKKIAAANSISTAVKSMALILIGYYFGKAYENLNLYLGIVTFAILAVLLVLYFALIRTGIAKKLLQ